ncbi:GIY-YIG nuclease family protein [Fulvivirga sp. RKSG066]|uniref:GIY-YIG nuclease family protein n=1 Tax=Fulvivirga aurantia TaxID=2529383 RepID=UPI0012BD2F9E|nr:GIY-YIG nuclease family protein [Fulvivirga aurantia]MTI19774.1 GIY-YIG nuclease family protein [Fulvivirga aurantia]
MGNYFVYILTNPKQTVLYTGMTNDLEQRLVEHYLNRGINKTFAGRYYCYNLLYYERHQSAYSAICREKEIKDWRRDKKISLIESINPAKRFLNQDIMQWPPHLEITSR